MALIPLTRLFFFFFYISHGVHNHRVNRHSSTPSSGRPAGPQSDFSKGELVHAPQLLHGDLEGVFIGVVSDDVVVHVNQNAVDDTNSIRTSLKQTAGLL